MSHLLSKQLHLFCGIDNQKHLNKLLLDTANCMTDHAAPPELITFLSGLGGLLKQVEQTYAQYDRDMHFHVKNHRSTALALSQAQRTAESAARSKNEFLANMSHELRTPMNGIIGITELVLSSPLEKYQYEYMTVVKSSANALRDMIDDVLEFSEMDAGTSTLVIGSFDFCQLLLDIHHIHAPHARQAGLELILDIDPGMPHHLIGDPNRIRQVLTNLVNNAIKFTPSGAITLHVKAMNHVDGMASLELHVRDTGIGIAAEKQGLIFEAFEQEDGSSTRRFGGTGLGLSITKRLVQMMLGKISVISEVGAGSDFIVEIKLPVDPYFENSAPRLTAPELENVDVNPVSEKNNHDVNYSINSYQHPRELETGLSILVVEDNELNQQLAIALLNNWGHTVDVANHGAEALELHRNEKYDLILMDMQMPVMDGATATIKIREREKNSHYHVTIIAMTANVLEGDQEECLSIGMDDYLSKPFKVDTFQSIIKKYSTILHAQKKPALANEHALLTTDEHFNYALALKQMDPQILALIAESFSIELPRQLTTIRLACAQRDLVVLQREAHTLSGLMGTFNAKPAQKIAIKIDRIARSHDMDNALDLFTRLEHETELFAIELQNFISQINTVATF
jgi:signal transduction histidine kinase/CheY-like chemotaxis protein